MFHRTLAALVLICTQTASADAAPLNPGEVIRGAYSFTTTGVSELEPVAFLLRLSSNDLFGDGDSVGIRYLDSTLNTLSYTRFDAVGTGLDPTVGLTFDNGDFLPGVQTKVPRSGFVEIEALQGSFDVVNLNLSGLEQFGAIGILRQSLVSDFDRVEVSPAAIPLPGGLSLSLAGVLALFGIRLSRQAKTPSTA